MVHTGRHAGLCTPWYIPTLCTRVYPLLYIPPYTPWVHHLPAVHDLVYTAYLWPEQCPERKPWAQRRETPWVAEVYASQNPKSVTVGVPLRAELLRSPRWINVKDRIDEGSIPCISPMWETSAQKGVSLPAIRSLMKRGRKSGRGVRVNVDGCWSMGPEPGYPTVLTVVDHGAQTAPFRAQPEMRING